MAGEGLKIKQRNSMKKFNPMYLILFTAIIAVAIAAWWLSRTFLEWEKPEISLSQSVDAIGLQKNLDISFRDQITGIRTISAAIYQDNQKHPIFSYDFRKGELKDKTLKTEILARNLKLHDGEAVLELKATDYSWLSNTKTLSIKTRIDLLPPQITQLSIAHNINPGGTCLTVYRISKDVDLTGVQIDSDLYKGYSISIGGKPCYVVFFPIPSEVSKSTRMSIIAQDKGGNRAVSSIPFFIRNVKAFRSDSVNLADSFLDTKMPEFQQYEPQLRGRSNLETFVAVNEKMRLENFAAIQEICKKTEPRQLWEGIFLRMKDGAPMALFGDKRTYIYMKSAIGASTHMGVDLASTQNAPVEAANNGIVLYAGYLGIYGNMVILDHGLGISTHYAHMNSIKVKPGQVVKKGEIIGNTGMTGFAGGDHLHYGMMVGNKFVNPIEWWDPHWIKDNVEGKLNIQVP